MIINPKDMTTEPLDTAIVFVFSSSFKVPSLECTLRAKKSVLLYDANFPFNQNHLMSFDVAEPIYTKMSYEELRDAVKAHVGDPEKTRLIHLGEDDLLHCAKIREDLNIPGPTLKEMGMFLNKTMQINRMREKNVRVPKGVFFEKKKYQNDPETYAVEIEQNVGLPIFCKPSNGVSAQGTMKVENKEQLKEALIMMSKAPSVYLIEEFIVGTMWGLDIAIINDEIRFFSCARKGHFVAEIFNGLPNIGIVHKSTDPIYQRMLSFAKDVVKAFGSVPDTWANLECFLTDDDEIVYCEINYRRPGSMICPGIKAYTGVNPEEIQVKVQACTPVKLPKDDFKTDWPVYSFYADWPNIKGTIKTKAPLPNGLTSKIQFQWYHPDGKNLTNPSHLSDNAAVAVFLNKDWDALQRDFDLMKNWQPYVYQ